jgi:hypothetical protein
MRFRSVAIALAALVLTACANSARVVTGAQASGSTHAGTRLSITDYPGGIGKPPAARRFSLRCGPAGGTVPNPARACRVLARLQHPFASVPAHTICSDLALGPQEAEVVGRLRGQSIRARLDVRDSCEIARWQRVAAVVPGLPRR